MSQQENEPETTDESTDTGADTESIEEQSGAGSEDQDADPSLNAPEEGRPDGQ